MPSQRINPPKQFSKYLKQIVLALSIVGISAGFSAHAAPKKAAPVAKSATTAKKTTPAKTTHVVAKNAKASNSTNAPKANKKESHTKTVAKVANKKTAATTKTVAKVTNKKKVADPVSKKVASKSKASSKTAKVVAKESKSAKLAKESKLIAKNNKSPKVSHRKLTRITASKARDASPHGQITEQTTYNYQPEKLELTPASDVVITKHWSPNIKDPIGKMLSEAQHDIDQEKAENWSSTSRHSLSAGQPELARAALNYLGIHYRMGGTSPGTGFDCSGLVQYVAKKHLGMAIPRVAASQANIGEKVDRTNLKPGDLLFFNTRGGRNTHVGVYLGNNEFVHAPRTGAVVRVEKISSYWNKRFNGARRLDNTVASTGHKVHF